jgi:hypothetical protein
VDAMNPLSQNFGKITGSVVRSGGGQTTVVPSAHIQTFRRGLRVAYEGADRALTNPVFMQSAEAIIMSPSRANLIYGQILLIGLIFLLRYWRFKKAESWYGRIWTNLWTGGLYWVGAIVVVPWVVLGQPYYQAVTSLIAMWTKGA